MLAVRQRFIRRRTMLRAAGAAMPLPLLGAMQPAFARQVDPTPRRMVAINVDLGFIPDSFFPKTEGKDYKPSLYMRPLQPYRDQFTVFSGVSHKEVDGGHGADRSFLTGAPHPLSAGFRNSVSLDQHAAETIGVHTRLPTLNLRVGPGNGSLAYTANGVRIPSEMVPSRVYEMLFVDGTPAQIAAQVRRLRAGQSLMDSFSGQIDQLRRDVGGEDRQRLDQYFSAVRDVEERLAVNEGWAERPKPSVDVPPPRDNLEPGDLVKRTRTMYELAQLAIETDSTRLITILVTQGFNPTVNLPGVELPHHALTHQSGRASSRKQLETIEEAQMKELGRLLGGLAGAGESGETLLDRTMVLQGSNLGHAGKHDNRNLPVVLAGGGFRHAGHLAFDRKDNQNLCELYVTMLQRLGVPTDRFGSAATRLSGLEV